MGCGASSAAGDKAIVTATRLDPPGSDSQPASQKPVEEPSAGTVDAKEQSKESPKTEKSSKETQNPPPDVSSSAQANAPNQTEPEASPKPQQNGEVKQDEVKPAETTKLAPKDASDQNGTESVGTSSGEKPAEGAQAASELPSTPSGDGMLTKRLSQNKLPPLKSPLATVDPSKDPFAKPVLPTAVPLHPAALSSPGPAPSSAGTPTPVTEAPGSKTPGSVAGTPKPADSPAPGTPVKESESKSPGPSNLSKSSNGSAAVRSESARSKTEQEPVHTPRAATEAALEALMDDVSAAH